MEVWESFFKSRGSYYVGFFYGKKNPKALLELSKNLHIETEADMLVYVDNRTNLVWGG